MPTPVQDDQLLLNQMNWKKEKYYLIRDMAYSFRIGSMPTRGQVEKAVKAYKLAYPKDGDDIPEWLQVLVESDLPETSG